VHGTVPRHHDPEAPAALRIDAIVCPPRQPIELTCKAWGDLFVTFESPLDWNTRETWTILTVRSGKKPRNRTVRSEVGVAGGCVDGESEHPEVAPRTPKGPILAKRRCVMRI
jgi:hypothetical protein